MGRRPRASDTVRPCVLCAVLHCTVLLLYFAPPCSFVYAVCCITVVVVLCLPGVVGVVACSFFVESTSAVCCYTQTDGTDHRYKLRQELPHATAAACTQGTRSLYEALCGRACSLPMHLFNSWVCSTSTNHFTTVSYVQGRQRTRYCHNCVRSWSSSYHGLDSIYSYVLCKLRIGHSLMLMVTW